MTQAPLRQRVVKLTEDLAFAVQPTEDELKTLKETGINSVINMREVTEKGFLPNEQEIVESQGLKYTLLPIHDANSFTKEYTDKILQTIDEFPKPCLVHCNIGLTAAVASLVWAAKKMGAKSEQVIQWGSEFGFNFAFHAKLYDFLKEYLDREETQ
jgi:uncharacterized protein (TIGR01244 family)